MAEIEQELRGRAHTTAIAALEVVPFAMLIADGAAQVLAVNGRWMELSGLDRAGSLGPGWLSVLETDPRSRLRDDVVRVGREGGTVTVDYQVGAGSQKRWTRWWISRHELERLPLVAIGAADVDADYARQANLYHLATHDSLTGLINRSHFIECIDQALRRSQRQSRHVAVVYVDLDGFKRVNDRGGHSLGDRVLFAIASRLRHAVRSADMVARIGGDEFAVLCEGLTAAEQADVVARRIALALTESVELDGERWSVAASVGAAVDRGDPDSAEELVDRADRAMYSIKQARRGPDGEDEAFEEVPYVVPQPERRVDPGTGYAYHTPRGPREEGRAEAGSASVSGSSAGSDRGPGREPDGGAAANSGSGAQARLGVLDPVDARQALRDLAEAAGAFAGRDEDSRVDGFGAGFGSRKAPLFEERRRAEAASADQSRQVDSSSNDDSSGPAGASPVEGPAAEPAADERRPDDSRRLSDHESEQAESGRHRLAADVLSLRESIDSIRRMLDRLLSAESGIIDIRDQSEL